VTTGQREQEAAGEVADEGASESALSETTIQEAHIQIERLRLSWDHLKRLLYLLKLCRYFDERMETLYRQGKVPGAFYDGYGQEAVSAGAGCAMAPHDRLCTRHRDLGAHIVGGVSRASILAQYMGRATGITGDRFTIRVATSRTTPKASAGTHRSSSNGST